MDSRFTKLRLNTYFSLVYQGLLLVTGFILPKLFLTFYGSKVNGLISSIAQFLSFINICDMGISAVVSSAYYRPLAEKNIDQVSSIFKYSKSFFNKIGVILCAYVAGLTVFYPKITGTSFSWEYTATLILAMSVSQFAQYFLGIRYQILINADQKAYIQIVINGGTLLLNSIACVVIMCLGGSIHFVKLSTSIIYLLRPLLMYTYVKKNYKLNNAVGVNSNIIPQKWNGVIQHLAYTINENTDIIVLTLFSTLESVSVYSVYILVTGGIKAIVNACTNSFLPLFGNIIAKEEKELLSKTYGLYEWLIHTIVTLLYTITGILIVPFVLLYTSGITDVSYDEPLFSMLIVMAYAVNCIRSSMHTIIKAAGHYRQTQLASLLEAALNVGISTILVFQFGLVGVAIGTLAATSFFTVYEIVYLKNSILFWNIGNVIKRFAIDALQIVGILILSSFVKVEQSSFFTWTVSAIEVTVFAVLVTAVIQVLFERDEIKLLLNRIKRKKV